MEEIHHESDDKFRIYQTIVERAWSDPEFKKRLIEQPNTVFAEYGVKLEPDVQIHVEIFKDTGTVKHFWFPEVRGPWIC